MANDATGAHFRPTHARRAVALIVLALAWVSTIHDAGAATPRRDGIDVLQVEGYLDAPNVTRLRDAIERANRRGSTLLVLQVDSPGAMDEDITPVLRAIRRSRVPIATWVGPSGAEAKGAATLVLEASHLAYLASGAAAGPGHPVDRARPDARSVASVRAQLQRLADAQGRDGDAAARLATDEVGSNAAARSGAFDGVTPTVGELIVSLDGRMVTTAAGDVELSTARVVGEGRDRRRQPNQEVRFDRLGIGDELLHTLIHPDVAYLLLMIGLVLIVFEFYTAAIGLAGAVGALALVGACVGFSHLPVRWWAAALLVVAVLGFSIDVQAGGLGFWTIVGAAALGVGSLTLYAGDGLGPSWWVLLVVCGGTAVFMLSAMTAMIRSRFSTPTIGREAMIGESGVAEVAVQPNGVVVIRGARWRARTNRATPIPAGSDVRVVAVEGLVLEVEPPEGGARDYRERRPRGPQPEA